MFRQCAFLLFYLIIFSSETFAEYKGTPALEAYPEKLLEEYRSCTVSYAYIKQYWDKAARLFNSENNYDKPDHYSIISNWFKAFRDPDICRDTKNIRRLVSYETQAQLVRIIDYSFNKNSALDECEDIAFSLLGEIYKQCDLAIDWADTNESLLIIEEKMKEIQNTKKDLKYKLDKEKEIRNRLNDTN